MGSQAWSLGYNMVDPLGLHAGGCCGEMQWDLVAGAMIVRKAMRGTKFGIKSLPKNLPP